MQRRVSRAVSGAAAGRVPRAQAHRMLVLAAQRHHGLSENGLGRQAARAAAHVQRACARTPRAVSSEPGRCRRAARGCGRCPHPRPTCVVDRQLADDDVVDGRQQRVPLEALAVPERHAQQRGGPARAARALGRRACSGSASSAGAARAGRARGAHRQWQKLPRNSMRFCSSALKTQRRPSHTNAFCPGHSAHCPRHPRVSRRRARAPAYGEQQQRAPSRRARGCPSPRPGSRPSRRSASGRAPTSGPRRSRWRWRTRSPAAAAGRCPPRPRPPAPAPPHGPAGTAPARRAARAGRAAARAWSSSSL